METQATIASLKDVLSTTLPVTCNVAVRYVHSKSRKCEPLFSPVPFGQPEKTNSTSHFLTVGYDNEGHILVYAIEVLVYRTSRLTTLFVSKADSTGYIPQGSTSPIKMVSTAFLKWLSDKERLRSPARQQVISLFGRAQGQYLFPGSAENKQKHVLDDRQLIKWWVKVLDPLFADDTSQRKGFITVPGYRGTELRQFLPAIRDHWTAGQPHRELARTRNVSEAAPTRCLLPRFPDDPKARFMQDLDDEVGLDEDAGASAVTSPSKRKNGKWKSIHSLDRFWEGMEFRQECLSGRVVGFLWILVGETTTSMTDSQMSYTTFSSSQNMSSTSEISQRTNNRSPGKKSKVSKPRHTGLIHTRTARIKGGANGKTQAKVNYFDDDGLCLTADGYDQAMRRLLGLDFANHASAVLSTSKWISEVASLCGLPKQSWTLDIRGTAPRLGKEVPHAANGQINDLGSMIRKKRPLQDASDADVTQTLSTTQPTVNLLSTGLIRKKPK